MTTSDEKRGLEALNHPTLCKQDIEEFCAGTNMRFMFLGEPDNMDSAEVFRLGTQDWPSKGVTVHFDKVIEWKRARAQIGVENTSGGTYREYTGGFVTTVAEALDMANDGASVIVYKDSEGVFRTLPKTEFFRVVSHEGKLMPRFAEAVDLRELEDLDDLFTVAEFEEMERTGAINSDDGCGNWATSNKESRLSVFSPKPSWATHVKWYPV